MSVRASDQRKQIDAELAAAQQRNELILASVVEGIHGLDEDGRIVFENAAALEMFGYAGGELIGRRAHDFLHDHSGDGSDYAAHDCPIHQTLADGRRRSGEDQFFRKDGSPFPVEYQCAPLRNDDGSVTGAVVTFRDITKRKRDEQLRQAENEILDMITAGTTLGAVLERVAHAVEQALPGTLASILLFDPKTQRLRRGTGPSLPEEYNRAIDGIEIGPEAGSCGTALYHRRRVIVEDIESDPLWANIRAFARRFSLRACWSTPVLDSNCAPLGTFALYYREPRSPTRYELALLDRLTRLISLSIERVRQSEALRASEARYRSMVELVPVAIWKEDWGRVFALLDELREAGVTDLRTHLREHPETAVRIALAIGVSDCNDAALRIFESRDEQELLSALGSGAGLADGRETFIEQVASAAAGEPRHEAEITLLTASGRPIQVLMSRSFPAANDASRAALVSLMDVSSRTEAESSLKERIKELNCLYRVLELTTDDTLAVDEACAQIGDILPQALLHTDTAVARIAFGGNEHRGGAEGEAAPAASLSSDIVVEGTVLGCVEIGYREARPDQQAGYGPFLAEERTLVDAIAVHVGRMAAGRRLRERLGQSEKLRATGELTGGVAHDFNNLLTVILGNSGLLTEQLDDPELAELAQMIREAADRGAELTNRLLAFARRQPLDPKPTDINERLASMDRLLRRTLGEHIEIEVDRAEALWPALIDAGQLESAVLNLCLNARDAMPDGGPLTIETANVQFDQTYADSLPEVTAGAYVMIAVSDTGCGMDAKTSARAFDPFFTTKQDLQGTGLGLSMVYGFAKQSNGHVAIYSEPGHGTVVKLYLPAAGADHDADELAREAATSGAGGGNETVLHVEDDDLVREHVAGQLRTLGYDVVSAGNGAEALRLLREDIQADVLFTDVVMPGGIDGRRLADEAHALRPDLPVLFTSGYTQNAFVHQGRLEAGVHLLQKPYRREELASKLRRVLER